MSYDYNQFSPKGGGNYQAWDQQGDRLAGTIISVGTGRDFDGNPVPELVINTTDGVEKKVSCGQTILHDLIIELQPQPGDGISIAFVGFKGNAKDFAVDVNRAQPQAAPVAMAPPLAAAPAPAPAPAPSQGMAPPPLAG